MKAGSYEAYSADKIARAETGDVVLFFHASWCPSCRGLNTSIESNLTAIPEGVTILKTDYDKEVELKKKYGVTYQHTLVQVDKDGNMIKKWSGGSSLDDIISQLQ
jgi:thioredoxin 1